ncbi:MAG TPA: toll/interleukin-1 receptor domain-containing protein [Anaerolineales bacterium]
MKPNIFMSYSRREVGFVDDLTNKLEKNGYKVWLDYRTLVPGTPWKGQIDAGLNDSDTVLLVVSKASMESKYVELEWRHFLEMKKRLILLIFEAVDLPKELEVYEWVDFRGNYENSLKELFFQLEQPIQEEHPVPESGFRVPIIVWVTFILSLIIAGYSFGAFWALFVPWFLISLPYRIFKRNFNFAEVQVALLILPVVLLLSAAAIYDPDKSDSLFSQALSSLLFVIPLFFILRSAGMQRWGKPEATMPKFANPYKPENAHPKPVPFFIDHAEQDRIVAEEMAQVFEKYGHPRAADLASAKAVFVLLSAFKTDTEADPQKQVVFPVLIQTTVPSQKLSKIQWVDFRSGVRNLDAMAQLLPEPAKLLAALGIRPLGNQLVLPSIIMAIRYFIILLGVFSAGAIVNYLLDFYEAGFDLVLGNEQAGGIVLGFILNLLLIGGLAFFLVRQLAARKGWFASLRNFMIGLVGLGIPIFFLLYVDAGAYDALVSSGEVADEPSPVVFYPIFIYIIGGVVMAVFLFLRRQDVRRWFPAKVKNNR